MEGIKMTTEEGLQSLVDSLSKRVEEVGNKTWSVCNASHYGWSKDEWDYRHDIMDTLRNRGYNVSSATNHGVLDITITKKITLK